MLPQSMPSRKVSAPSPGPERTPGLASQPPAHACSVPWAGLQLPRGRGPSSPLSVPLLLRQGLTHSWCSVKMRGREGGWERENRSRQTDTRGRGGQT